MGRGQGGRPKRPTRSSASTAEWGTFQISEQERVKWDRWGSARRLIAQQNALVAREAALPVANLWAGCLTAHPELYRPLDSALDAPPKLLREWWEKARETTYAYHCVLSGSPATFGVELEFLGDLAPIARALHENGLSTVNRVVRENIPDSWVVKEDDTVANGGEVVSPILRDDPRSWQSLAHVCMILQRQGCRVDASCGTHVHVGADRLGDDPTVIVRLIRAGVMFEDLLYRLGTLGRERAHRGTVSAYPWSSRLLARYGYQPVPTSVPQFKADYGPQHIDAINLERLGRADGETVEFRIANGTLHPLEIQALVTLDVGLVEFARRPLPELPIPDQNALGAVLERGGDTTHWLVRAFLDAVFARDERARLRVLWLYQRSQWQSRALAPTVAESTDDLGAKLLARKRKPASPLQAMAGAY